MKTDKLIQMLADDLKPVKRKHPLRQAALYLAAALAFFAAMVVLSTSFLAGAHIPYYSVEIFMILSVFVASVYAVLRASIPGTDSKILYIPVALFVAWGVMLAYRFFTSGAVIHEHGHSGCVTDILLFSVLPLLLLLKIVKSNAPVNTAFTFFVMLVGILSLAAGATQYLCPDESAFHLLSEHWLSVLLASLAGLALGRKILRW